MITTFGKMPTSLPAGFFKAVHFPVLAKLDQVTYDRRKLMSDGAGARDLPFAIKFAPKTSAMGGHDGADISGALFQITVDPETGVMSGDGFLLNDENGRKHARYIATGAMRGNSVDLADVRARYVEDFETGDYWVEFTEFKIGTTTGVSIPAFGEATTTVDALTEEELMASLVGDDPMDPLVVQVPDEFYASIIGEPVEEIVASGAQYAPFDAFYRSETDRPQKIVVDADGNVYGHLAVWDTCHDGYSDKCLRVPRPNDGYASFNQAGPLTERGQVETGPIFALGGHRKAKSAPTIEQAYGGIENAWADVRIIEGRFGPWISGIVRPGTSDEVVYAARASRISGHWVNGKLKAIVSVNVPGYEVPGSGDFAIDFSTGFAYATNDEGVAELVASFPSCVDEAADQPDNQLTLNFTVTNGDPAKIADAVASAIAANSRYFTMQPTTTTGVSTLASISFSDGTPVAEPEADESVAAQRAADEAHAYLLETEDSDS
jgi:hypothetical protein